jgi:hypothetical protein
MATWRISSRYPFLTLHLSLIFPHESVCGPAERHDNENEFFVLYELAYKQYRSNS